VRITTELQYSEYSNNIDAAEQRLMTAQQQETTGYKINSASDDPSAALQIMDVTGLQNQLTEYQSNITTATGNLGLTGNALTSANTIMQNAQNIALEAANSTMDSTTLQSFATQVANLQQELVNIGNQQNSEGEYLFAGQKTDKQPFTVSAGALTYNGDGNSINVSVGPNVTVASNIPGSPMFTDAYSALEALQNDLQSGNISNISNNDLTAIKSAATEITVANGTVGARVDELQTLTNDNTRRQAALTTQLSGLQDVDAATAATNYTEAQTAYQAALSVLSQASNLTLPSFLSTSNA
jgi:flagellar hook-associated protein 3 FlgL